MAVRLNTERSFWTPVPLAWLDPDGKQQEGSFRAKFRVMSGDELEAEDNQDKRLVDLVLLDLDELELVGDGGELLEGEALLEAAKMDPAIGAALLETYREANRKKPRRKISGK